MTEDITPPGPIFHKQARLLHGRENDGADNRLVGTSRLVPVRSDFSKMYRLFIHALPSWSNRALKSGPTAVVLLLRRHLYYITSSSYSARSRYAKIKRPPCLTSHGASDKYSLMKEVGVRRVMDARRRSLLMEAIEANKVRPGTGDRAPHISWVRKNAKRKNSDRPKLWVIKVARDPTCSMNDKLFFHVMQPTN